MRALHSTLMAALVVASAGVVPSAACQRAGDIGAARLRAAAPDTTSPGPIKLPTVPRFLARADSAWWLPLTSALMPGTGQLLLRQDRAIAYAAAEGLVLIQYFNASGEEARDRDRSRSLARDVARAAFGGARAVGPWAYYENMEHYVESGVFNRFPDAEFSPEVDLQTYNGWLWLDVRRRYWDNPNVEPLHTSAAYVRALNEYLTRAVRDEGRWSWRNAQLEQDVFRRTIKRKNQAAQTATEMLSLLVANHLLSTVDAFVAMRVRGLAGAGGRISGIEVSLPWEALGRPER